MAEFDMFDVDEGDVDTFAMPPTNGTNWAMSTASTPASPAPPTRRVIDIKQPDPT